MKKNLEYGLNWLYPTPVHLSKISEADCAELLTTCFKYENAAAPENSDKSDLIRHSPLLRKLATEKFDEYLKTVFDVSLHDYHYKLKAWMTGSRDGYSMDTHNHSGSPFVSVFYVLSEQKNAGGELVLTDPRVNANRGYQNEFIRPFDPTVFMPDTGDVVIFPGYLYHHVRRFDSKLRIAIPVDLFLVDGD